MEMFKLYLGGYVSIKKEEATDEILVNLYDNEEQLVRGFNLGVLYETTLEYAKKSLIAPMHENYNSGSEEFVLYEFIPRCTIISIIKVNEVLRECRDTRACCVRLSPDYYDDVFLAPLDDTASVYNYGYILQEDIDSNSDFVWCEEDGEYAHEDDVTYGVVGRRWQEGYWISRNWDHVYSEAANVYFVSHEVATDNDYDYCNSRDTYVHVDDLRNDYNADYHGLSRKYKHDYSKDLFSIGFEIEKEDADAIEIGYHDLYDDTGWCKENDSSLCDETGYELVSPTFCLYDDGLEKDIDSNRNLETLINGDWCADTCGGHINLGHRDFSPHELFDGLSSFMPLIYSLYENRLNKDYSRAKKKYEYHRNGDKYQSVYIKGHVVEFRIFPAVRNVKNLIWRRDLLRIMCSNMFKSEIDILRMMTNDKSDLYKHLKKIYSDDTIVTKVGLFIKYSREYNLRTMPNLDLDKLREKNKKKNKKKGDDNLSSELGA